MFFEMIGCPCHRTPCICSQIFLNNISRRLKNPPKRDAKNLSVSSSPLARKPPSPRGDLACSFFSRSWFASPGPRAVQRRLHREPPQLWLQWPPRSLGPGRPDKRARARGDAVRYERWRRTSGEERDPSYVTRMARNGTHFDPSDVGVWGKYTGSTKNLHL